MKTIIKQAEDFRRIKTLKYVDTGQPVNLSGCSAYCQMRTTPDGEMIANAECEIQTGAGRVIAAFPSSVTAEIPIGDYGFDIWLVDGDSAKPIHTEQISIVGRYTHNFEVPNA